MEDFEFTSELINVVVAIISFISGWITKNKIKRKNK